MNNTQNTPPQNHRSRELGLTTDEYNARLRELRADHIAACDELELSQDQGWSRKHMRELERNCIDAFDAICDFMGAS